MDVLAYVLVGAGGLLALARLAPTVLILNLRSDAFAAQIVKLCKAGNRDRAKKLCAAVPRAMFPRVVAAMIEGAENARPDDGPSMIRERIGGAFDQARERELTRARAHGWVGWVAIAAGAGTTALALSGDPMNPGLAAAGAIPVLLVVASWKKLDSIDRAARARRDELVDVLAATVA